MTMGDITTVNLTMMSGGVQMNVVPDSFTLGFDMRITPTTDIAQFEKMIRDWCDEVPFGNSLVVDGLLNLFMF